MNKKNIPVFTDDEQKKAIEFLTAVETIMRFAESVPAEERKNLRKVGDDSMEFINKCFRAAEVAKDHFPANFDLDNFKKAIALYDAMQPVVVKKKMLDEKIEDTLMWLKSIMVIYAEDTYSILKRASKQDGEVKTLADDLGSHYKGRGAKKKKPKGE